MEYIILPTPNGIRAARAFLSWKQLNLAHKCDVNVRTIFSIENGKSKPTKELLEKITRVFLEEGIKFKSNGGFDVDKDIVTVYEGEDSFLKIQKDILRICNDKDEVLIIGNDDSKCTKAIIENDKKLYEADIYPKSLIAKGNDYIIGPIEDYRAVSKSSFVPADFSIIYKDKVAFDLQEKKGKKIIEKILVLKEETINTKMRNYFWNLWENGEKIKKSSTKQIFFKK